MRIYIKAADSGDLVVMHVENGILKTEDKSFVIDAGSKGYYFLNDITDREINVLVSYMVAFFIEWQLDNENNYKNLYADKNVTTYSSGNLISSIEKAFSTS